MIVFPERLTHEVKVGPFGALKNDAANSPCLFTNYEGFFAYLEAVTRLQIYEDLVANERVLFLPKGLTVNSLIRRISAEKRKEEDDSSQPSPSYTTGYSAGTHIGMANVLTELTKLYTQEEKIDLQSLNL